MTKLQRPRGMIDYESWNNIERGRRGEARDFRLVRPKTIALTAACLALAATLVVSFAMRTSGAMSVQHDRDPLAAACPTVPLETPITSRLLNKSTSPQHYTLGVEGLDATMTIVGNEFGRSITVPADGSETLRVTLTMARPKDAEVVFVAKEAAVGIALSVRDRFIDR